MYIYMYLVLIHVLIDLKGWDELANQVYEDVSDYMERLKSASWSKKYVFPWVHVSIMYMSSNMIDCFFFVLHPARESHTHMDTSPLVVKGCKI
jgi:hypothetical protein